MGPPVAGPVDGVAPARHTMPTRRSVTVTPWWPARARSVAAFMASSKVRRLGRLGADALDEAAHAHGAIPCPVTLAALAIPLSSPPLGLRQPRTAAALRCPGKPSDGGQ